MNIECSICVNNKSSSLITKCPFCKIEICTKCVKTYIFDKKSSIIECMNCKKVWSRSILQDLFSKTFVDGKLKKHIKDMMFLEQKTQIPNTLHIVDRLREILNEYSIEDIKSISSNLLEDYIYWAMEGNKPENQKTEYVYPCANPECLGHVNTVWKCTMCKGTTCKNCLVFIPENCNNEHQCKKEDIETANLIKKTSKPCPGCHISIIKTQGCDQMWCSKCHVAFDWKTGKKVTTRIHNPEYYRWLRETNGFVPREHGDDPCNNKLSNCMDIFCNLVKKKKIDRKIYYQLHEIQRCIIHIEDYMINRIQYKINDTNDWYSIQRVRFLIKYISEDQFKINLGRKYKETLYLEEKIAICTTLRDVIRDRLVNLIDLPNEELVQITMDKVNNEIKIINTNIEMSNSVLKNIMNLYGYTVDRLKWCNIIKLS